MKTIGSRAEVLHGVADHTSGGLIKSNLKMSDGRIVSKKQQAAGKKNPGLKAWRKAVTSAKKDMGIAKKGEFVLIKGKLLKETRKIFAKGKK